MAQYDIESVLTAMRAFLVANLNNQLSALDTEKSDGIALKPVDASAFHLQYSDDVAKVYDPFVVFGEYGPPRGQPSGDSVATTYDVAIWVVLAWNGTDPDIVKRLFRYRRALKDLVKANWTQIYVGHKVAFKELSPTEPFKDLQSQYQGQAVGIVISLTIVE